MVESAPASASVSGPTRRSVAGADAGDADVAGGAEGLLPLTHALRVSMAAATKLTTTPCVAGIGSIIITISLHACSVARLARLAFASAKAFDKPGKIEGMNITGLSHGDAKNSVRLSRKNAGNMPDGPVRPLM